MLMNCFKKDKNTNETQFEQKCFHLKQRKSSNRATLTLSLEIVLLRFD
jgi:hypothetical protein